MRLVVAWLPVILAIITDLARASVTTSVAIIGQSPFSQKVSDGSEGLSKFSGFAVEVLKKVLDADDSIELKKDKVYQLGSPQDAWTSDAWVNDDPNTAAVASIVWNIGPQDRPADATGFKIILPFANIPLVRLGLRRPNNQSIGVACVLNQAGVSQYAQGQGLQIVQKANATALLTALGTECETSFQDELTAAWIMHNAPQCLRFKQVGPLIPGFVQLGAAGKLRTVFKPHEVTFDRLSSTVLTLRTDGTIEKLYQDALQSLKGCKAMSLNLFLTTQEAPFVELDTEGQVVGGHCLDLLTAMKTDIQSKVIVKSTAFGSTSNPNDVYCPHFLPSSQTAGFASPFSSAGILPIASTGLVLLVPAPFEDDWFSKLTMFTQPFTPLLWAGLCVSVMLIGIIFWLLESPRSNTSKHPDGDFAFGGGGNRDINIGWGRTIKGFYRNIDRTLWLSFVGLGNAGKHSPTSNLGRIFSVFWCLATFLLVGAYIAGSTGLLLDRSNSRAYPIVTVQDAVRMNKVACIPEDSPGANYAAMQTIGLNLRYALSSADGAAAVKNGTCDCLVGVQLAVEPLLADRQLVIAGPPFAPHTFGFGLHPEFAADAMAQLSTMINEHVGHGESVRDTLLRSLHQERISLSKLQPVAPDTELTKYVKLYSEEAQLQQLLGDYFIRSPAIDVGNLWGMIFFIVALAVLFIILHITYLPCKRFVYRRFAARWMIRSFKTERDEDELDRLWRNNFNRFFDAKAGKSLRKKSLAGQKISITKQDLMKFMAKYTPWITSNQTLVYGDGKEWGVDPSHKFKSAMALVEGPGCDGLVTFDSFMGWYIENHMDLKLAFDKWDPDGRDAVSRSHFVGFLVAVGGLSKKEVAEALDELDRDANGSISFTEFMPWYVDRLPILKIRNNISKQRVDHTNAGAIEQAFVAYCGTDGTLETKELRHFLAACRGGYCGRGEISDAIVALDPEECGNIDKDTFIEWFMRTKGGREIDSQAQASDINNPMNPMASQ